MRHHRKSRNRLNHPFVNGLLRPLFATSVRSFGEAPAWEADKGGTPVS